MLMGCGDIPLQQNCKMWFSYRMWWCNIPNFTTTQCFGLFFSNDSFGTIHMKARLHPRFPRRKSRAKRTTSLCDCGDREFSTIFSSRNLPHFSSNRAKYAAWHGPERQLRLHFLVNRNKMGSEAENWGTCIFWVDWVEASRNWKSRIAFSLTSQHYHLLHCGHQAWPGHEIEDDPPLARLLPTMGQSPRKKGSKESSSTIPKQPPEAL